MDTNYKKLYLKYKSKYLELKSSKTNQTLIMTGGFDLVSAQVKQINIFIEQIENSIKKSGEKSSELIGLTNQLENYLVEQDIPIDLKFNPYMLSELTDALAKLKSSGTNENLSKIYEQRNKIYSMDETNYIQILDHIIQYNKISSVKDIEKLFSSLILGSNKNYIIYYMVLLRYLIVNKIQFSVLEEYSPILSLYGLKSCLSTGINSDDYLPLIINLIYDYINLFPIKKTLLIKKPSEFEQDKKSKQKLLELESTELVNTHMIVFDTKNKIFQYESGEIKEMVKINFEDLVKILFNLFRIYIPKFKPDFVEKTNSEEKSTL
jgi:hypothetical protein